MLFYMLFSFLPDNRKADNASIQACTGTSLLWRCLKLWLTHLLVGFMEIVLTLSRKFVLICALPQSRPANVFPPPLFFATQPKLRRNRASDHTDHRRNGTRDRPDVDRRDHELEYGE